MAYNEFKYNFMFATLIFWTGGFGYFIMRLMKNEWTKQQWSYVPVFWFPILGSWPVAAAALFGTFD
jgi:hypothetical protein